ncbi:MAG: GNAT superfamily N-acetyltransferase [Psychromonas sp.]|jgi:GNAT superfamily N-acetyltransferase|uniref:GNAT family N-acetyltransferase n=1 Tax=Psychromonas sp. TaxID=1884585 RepID=UPI0039E54F81
MIYSNKQFYIYDESGKVNLQRVKALLEQSYWAKDRSLSVIDKSIKHSECLSLYDDDYQIGFARVVTDYSTFGYLADVIVMPEYRGKDLGKWLVETVVNDPRWKNLFLVLATGDAHDLYQRHGFEQSSKLMGIM